MAFPQLSHRGLFRILPHTAKRLCFERCGDLSSIKAGNARSSLIAPSVRKAQERNSIWEGGACVGYTKKGDLLTGCREHLSKGGCECGPTGQEDFL